MKPILYKESVHTRFSDLDPYGHVNAKHYLDFVIESRLRFFNNKFGLSLEKVAKTGTGFYLIKSEMNYTRPVIGTKSLDIETFVDSIKDETTLVIPYIIKDLETQKTYSQGIFYFAVVDIATGKPTPLKEEMKLWFFE